MALGTELYSSRAKKRKLRLGEELEAVRDFIELWMKVLDMGIESCSKSSL